MTARSASTALLLAIAACRTVEVPPQGSAAVFADPAAYLGQEVQVCGHLVHGNLLSRRRPPRTGLNLAVEDDAVEDSIVRRLGTGTCLRGTIFHAGCRSGSACLEWAFDYGIMVRAVAPDRPLP